MKFTLAAAAVYMVATVTALPITKEVEALTGSIGTLYSADLTRNIFVKGIHSHNDYWRDIPLYTALSYGVVSVEADVFLYNGKLHVGHKEGALNDERMFDSLYINPLVEILTAANPQNAYTQNVTTPSGVFDTNGEQTLYLFVDLKTDGNETWPYVIEALEPLRRNNWLTKFNGTDVITGPVTVVGTGNTPYDFVSSQKTRDYFFDSPVASLNSSYPATLGPIASGSFRSIFGEIVPSGLNDTQLSKLQDIVDTAHSMGILTRFWDVPWWPVNLQNTLWRQIIASGSDLLNADDLELASGFA
ncbi:altered inheritance of mitochondria protein 6 [Lipomyces arxii]|uniref:altered inheritance of mitochondria protein 6 n=1 Tax=Lipomyces arxii TaxID=56418 RepID=UPI0034CF1304